MAAPVYFLIRDNKDYITIYARGVPLLGIDDLATFEIYRYYPDRVNLTHRLICLQRRWRSRRNYQKWCAHPYRLLYRESHGRFPVYSAANTIALPSSSTN